MSKYEIVIDLNSLRFEIQAEDEEDNKCDVCETPDGEPHCDCGNCDCREETV